MLLFFDTETTGLPKNWKAPITDLANWPRLVQLAYLIYDLDGNLVAEHDYIIKPDGFDIPKDASRIHGITTEKAHAEGKPLAEVLAIFRQDIESASHLVAHNMAFDEKIAGAEFLRLSGRNGLDGKRKICTMNEATNYCAIRGPYGNKWPSLAELHRKVFGHDFEHAHNAMVDIQVTARCFWALRDKKILFTHI